MRYLECAKCGYYHPEFFEECDNVQARYTLEELEYMRDILIDVEIVSLWEQKCRTGSVM